MFTRFIAVLSIAIPGLTLPLLLPTRALAAGECNGFVNIQYPDFPLGPDFNIPPLPVPLRMKVSLGTGSITGGPMNTLTVTSFTLDLACNADFPLLPGCEPDGPPNFPPKKVDFVAMFQDMCAGSVFTPTIGGPGLTDNVVTFTANPPLVIPKEQATLPGFCSVEFTVQVLEGFSSDTATPGDIEEVVGYGIAQCDNGVLVSSGSQTSSIRVRTPTNDFNCYEIKKAPHLSGTITVASPFVAPRVVNKQDLTPVRRVCAPAVKVTAADPDPTVPTGQHLVGYQIRNFGPFDTVKGVVVTVPQFPGLVTVDVTKPNLLLVPSDKNGENTGGMTETSNHFICHTLDNVKGAVPPGVTVRDQFGTQSITFKSRRWRLCTPVNKDGGDPPAETATTGLLCYVVGEVDQNPAKKLPVSWANQFETNNTRLDQMDDFCVTAAFVKP
jgi:hypothetical protein